MRRIPAVLGLLLLTAACGTAHPGASGGPDTLVVSAVGPPPTSVVMSPPPSASVGLNHAMPDPSVVDLKKTRFTQATPGAGNELVVQYTASGRAECAKLGRVDVTESADAVTVTVLLGQVPGVNCAGPQPMIAAIFQTTVTLKAPLGSRPVHDGAS
ncbi:hypothetical protein [Kutzneria sp. CA-103260]|uniref:hypothetical protein n=1 Tax=Kutzneria sp. CA-103260 TaxID=2802641 RepID=UPI001BA891BC|nr:hypothetical protein [Kutzneria sp. CA-103260]QUQ64875.1 hypothetical protein JJ691_25960 [Kutzneria sp. CA-103260]